MSVLLLKFLFSTIRRYSVGQTKNADLKHWRVQADNGTSSSEVVSMDQEAADIGPQPFGRLATIKAGSHNPGLDYLSTEMPIW